MKAYRGLDLPEWAFLDAHSHLGDPLTGRTVILHIRSATLIEIFDRDRETVNLKDGILTFKFDNANAGYERLMAAVHYSATLDIHADATYIKENILKPCAQWYCEYCDWEDENMLNDE
jgi:hypothetical protein